MSQLKRTNRRRKYGDISTRIQQIRDAYQIETLGGERKADPKFMNKLLIDANTVVNKPQDN